MRKSLSKIVKKINNNFVDAEELPLDCLQRESETIFLELDMYKSKQ